MRVLDQAMYEKYMVFKDLSSRYGSARYNKPIFLANFFSVVLIWSFYDIFSSNITTRNLTDDFLLIMLLRIFNSGLFKHHLSLVEFSWNKVYLLLVTFKDNLFPLNHSQIFCNSQFFIFISNELFTIFRIAFKPL